MLGCPFPFFVPSPLSDFYEWVVLAACCLNVVFEKWAEPKNSALFESAVVCESGQKAREKSCSWIRHKHRPSWEKERKKKETDSVTESGHWGALRGRHSGQERSLGFPKHTFIQSLSHCRIKTLAPEHIVFERNTELHFHNRCTQLYCNPHNETLRNLFPSATHTYLKGFSWALLHA